MNDAKRASLKQHMLEEMDKLRQNIAVLEQQVNPVAPDVAIGRLSRLDTMLNQGVNESSLSQTRQRLLQLEYALRELENPDSEFGYCEECGEPIPEARLLALPETRFCVECAE